MTTLIEKIVGELGDKRRWRAYRARVTALPAGCRTTGEALERYLTYFGMVTKGDLPTDVLMSMLEDLADLVEQAAAQEAPIRAVAGEDPVEFAETFFRNYVDGRWTSRQRDPSLSAIEREFRKEVERGINEERARLVKAIGRAEAQDSRSRS
jgi:DNA-binding ferritin-like protein (Dps family)